MAATLIEPGRPGVRLHVFGDMPVTTFTALSPDPSRLASKLPSIDAEAGEGRSSLILRRRSPAGATLRSTFVTVFEPIGEGVAPLRRVGRVGSLDGRVLLYVETADGPEYLLINLKPGTPQAAVLPDGHAATTEGLVLRLSPSGMQLAGGTTGAVGGAELRQEKLSGRVLGVGRTQAPDVRGWFEVEGSVDQFTGVEGRALLIGHGDGSVHGWTIRAVEDAGGGRVRVRVREEPGFLIDPSSSQARYYQFPRAVSPGPHEFSVSRIVRSDVVSK